MVTDKGKELSQEVSTSAEPATPAAGRKRRSSKGTDPHVSNALRSAYQATVQEDVPSEFIDLLGKLA